MLPTVRVLVERAASARYQLSGLIAVLPPGMLDYREDGDDWPVRVHIAHALSSDELLLELLAAGTEVFESWLEDLPGRRAQLIADASVRGHEELIESAHACRTRLIASLASLTHASLEASVPIPGVRTAWGDERRITLYEYLEAWSNHDLGHEQAIRRAIRARPDLSAVALTRRRR